ncbi:MAG: helix-turn-helix domain-containing protein [Chloroflexota bacterium]
MSRRRRPDAYSDIQIQVGLRILWARELVVPNRAQFARLCGLDTSTISKIEAGDRPPSIFNVLSFATKLRVDPNYVLSGSIRGVDPELLAQLVARHPELANRQRRAEDAPGVPLETPIRPAAGQDIPRTARARRKQNSPKKRRA